MDGRTTRAFMLLCGASQGACGTVWRELSGARLTPPRSGHVACADQHGRVWTFGGYAETKLDALRHLPLATHREPTNDVWRWGRGVGWTCVQEASDDAGTRPGPRLCSAAAIVRAGFESDRLVVMGGWDPRPAGTGGAILSDVWSLDLDTGAWERLDDMPGGPTSRHVACTVGEQLVVHTHRGVLRWDAAARRLVEQRVGGRSPSARGLQAAAPLGGSKMLVFGGAAQSGEMAADAFALTFEQGAAAPSARAGAAAAAAGEGRAVVACGAERAPCGGLIGRSDAWLLDAGADGTAATWRRLSAGLSGGDLEAPRGRNAATLTPLASAAAAELSFLLHGGWEPFVCTYNDDHELSVQAEASECKVARASNVQCAHGRRPGFDSTDIYAGHFTARSAPGFSAGYGRVPPGGPAAAPGDSNASARTRAACGVTVRDGGGISTRVTSAQVIAVATAPVRMRAPVGRVGSTHPPSAPSVAPAAAGVSTESLPRTFSSAHWSALYPPRKSANPATLAPT